MNLRNAIEKTRYFGAAAVVALAVALPTGSALWGVLAAIAAGGAKQLYDSVTNRYPDPVHFVHAVLGGAAVALALEALAFLLR